jgi:hypothetical protein
MKLNPSYSSFIIHPSLLPFAARVQGFVELSAARKYGFGGVIPCRTHPCYLLALEAVRLRVKDIDFERTEITIREAKGAARGPGQPKREQPGAAA